ncbi:4Fe-4S binding protein [Candidatus Bathyarchaeota archaeon]|nr:4Fe-4S binding protein [Candidatus Bathyarchaeota archaeon]
MRGELVKQEKRRETKIKRSFLKRSYVICLNKELCDGCGICTEICPKEAITEVPAKIVEGHLTKKPTIDFDVDKCILCGECAVLCPLNALTMQVNGEEISIVVKNEAFPSMVKDVQVAKEEIPVYEEALDEPAGSRAKTKTELTKCDPRCELVCQEECPTEAIKVRAKTAEDGELKEIVDVEIDKGKCCYCKRCMLACPFDAIVVKKPYQGTIKIDTRLCPEDCEVCKEICPTRAIQMEKGKPVVQNEFCVFCSACQKVCPEKAINVQRQWVFHTDIKAAAWLTALKKLTSEQTVSKELRIKSLNKKFNRVKARVPEERNEP